MTCQTKKKKNCKLPFIFKGITYKKCPVDPIDPKETWCSINIDSNGIHVNGRKNYEFCSDNCPKYDFSDFDRTPGPLTGKYVLTYFDKNFEQAFYDVNPQLFKNPTVVCTSIETNNIFNVRLQMFMNKKMPFWRSVLAPYQAKSLF